MFGKENFFLEIQDHGLDQDKIVIPRAAPAVARHAHSAGGHQRFALYARKDDARAHEILLCIQTGKTMSDPQRMRFTHPEFYLKTRDEMLRMFGELEDALDRTWEIAQRCQVKLEKVKEPFPKFDVPRRHSTDTYFEYVARQGFEKRRPRLEAMRTAGALKHDLAEYAERLDREIRMIQQMKFSGYFLDRLGLHPLRQIERHSGGPGPRVGGRQPGQLLDGDHRYRSAASTGCCSSASSIRSASACRISISTSTPAAAAR